MPQPQAVEHRRVVRRPRGASLPGEVGQDERPVGPGFDGACIRGELSEARVGRELRVEDAADPVQGEAAVVDRAADEPVPFVKDVAPRPLGRVDPALVDEMANGAARPDRDHGLAGAREPGPDVGHRAIAPAGDDRQSRRKPRRGRRVAGQAAHDRAGGDEGGELLRRDARRAQRVRVPRAGHPVEQPCRGGEADVGRPSTGERVEDPVLDPHEPAGTSRDVRGGVGPPAQADRVVGGANRAARSRVDGGDVELRPDGLLHTGGPVVRPGHRVRQGRAPGIDREAAVHRAAERDPGRRDLGGRGDRAQRPGDGLPDDQDVLLGPAGPGHAKRIGLAGGRDHAALGVEENRLAAGRPEIQADHAGTSSR
jgi:hypothetical protein